MPFEITIRDIYPYNRPPKRVLYFSVAQQFPKCEEGKDNYIKYNLCHTGSSFATVQV